MSCDFEASRTLFEFVRIYPVHSICKYLVIKNSSDRYTPSESEPNLPHTPKLTEMEEYRQKAEKFKQEPCY